MTDNSKKAMEKFEKTAEYPPEIILRETDTAPFDIQFEDIYTSRAIYQKIITGKESAYVSILILAYNNLQKHTKYCIESILRHTDNIDYELVLVDNGSSDGTLDFFKSVPYKRKKIVRITNNKGANYGVYLGMKHSVGRYVVVIANDVYVTKNWLSNMLRCAESDRRIGFVAPASDNVSNLQSINLPFASLEEMQLKAAQHNISDPRKWEERLRLMPAIALFKNECLDIMGGLDYAFQHDFSDDDISIRIRRAGYKLVFCGDVFVHHSGPSVTGASSEKKKELLREGRETFKTKYYGIDPWDDISNFDMLVSNLVNPEEKRNISKPQVLGVYVKCGTPILQLKNKLRLADIFDVNLSAFEENPKYWLDLKTICEGKVAIDRIDNLKEHFSPKSFDYILSGKPVNFHEDTEKILTDMLSVLKDDGQLLINIKNQFDVKSFIDSSGKILGNDNKKFYTNMDINNLNNFLARNGFSIKDIRKVLHNIDDSTRDAVRKVLEGLDGVQNVDAALNALLTEEYLLKIALNTESKVEWPTGKPPANEKVPSDTVVTVPGEDPLLSNFKNKVPTANLTSIVIITCNGLEYTKKCVKSLQNHTPEAHEIIFVDNGSTDNTVLWIKRLIKENKNYRLIENKDDSGFAKGCNLGIEVSGGEFILLLSNDIEVSGGWLTGMLKCFRAAPEAGIIGPMANYGTGLQKAVLDGQDKEEHPNKIAHVFYEKYRNRRISYRKLEGFCMLVHRSIIEKIGFFDETFCTDNFADEDLCLRAALEGYQNYIAGDIYVRRNVYKTPSKDRVAINKKWTISTAKPEGKKLAVLRATEIADEIYQKGDIDQTVETLVNCIKISPDAKEIYYALARIFIETKRFSEAWDVVGTMPEPVRDSMKGLECSAYAKEGLGLDGEAATFTDMMLELNGRYPPALNMKGVLAYKKGDRETARVLFQSTIDADPGYGEAYTNLGVLYWSMDKQDEAMSNLRSGFILSPIVPDVNSLYYSVASALGQYAEAETELRNAVALYPNNKNLAFLLIDSLIQQGKLTEAIFEVENTLALFGLDEGTLNAALSIRETIGHLQIDKTSKKGTLSLCMIVKNEEKHLVKCLQSVRDIVDEIIIVDTGSTDKTIDIARVFGAQIFEFPWTGDFSAARNESLNKASGNWLLVLDADEVLSPLDFKKLKDIVRKRTSSPVAYSVVTRNYIKSVGIIGWTKNDGEYPEEAGTGWVTSTKVRLFTRNSKAFFSNPVHETLEYSLSNAKIPIRSCKVIVHHYGKLDEQKDMQKGEDYYLLGRIKYESDPANMKYVMELAKQAQVLGKYEEAIGLWLELISLIEANPDSPGYREIARTTYGDPMPEIYAQLASAYMLIDRLEEALAAARKTMDGRVKLKEYVHVYAHCEMIAGSPDNAFHEIEELLKATPDYPPALLLKGAIFCLKGEKDNANATFRSLLERNVQITGLLNRYARQFQTMGKKSEALLILNTVVVNGIGDKETERLLGALQRP